MANNSYFEYLVQETSSEFKRQGLNIGEMVIELVIRQAMEVMRNSILNGDKVYINGIGELEPTWRRVSLSHQGYTSKIRVNLDESLKKEMDRKLVEDPEYRSKLNATDDIRKFGS